MNDKTKTPPATGPILYRVNYNWVNSKFQLRQGTLVLPANSETEAREKAKAELTAQAFDNFRIGKIVHFD